MGFSIDRMLAGELLEANDVLLLGNMSLLRGRLARLGPSETVLTSTRFIDETGMGYRKLAVAVLDEDRRILRASSEFNIPVSALPEKAIPIEALPDRVDNAVERELHARFGGLSRSWTAPDGRWYQVLLARLPLASGASDQPPSVLIALSYDRSLPRELLARYRKGLLETLVVSVLAAAALGIWAVRVVLKRGRRSAATSSTISAQALNQRLSLDDTPEEFLESTLAFNHMLDRLEDSFKRLSGFSSHLAPDPGTPNN